MRKALWIDLYHFDTMAMRPRGGGGRGSVGSRRGTRAGVVRPVYEDFKPASEWQQDDESYLLIIYLPGFMKEQIKITTEGWNTIRVHGERLVAGNKWSWFSEDFQVPENGEMNSVRAKFQGGIITISVPKEVARKPQDALPPQNRDINDIRKQPTPQKPTQMKATSQAKNRQSFPADPQTKRGHDEIQKQPKTQKGQVKAVQEVKGGADQQSFAADTKTKSSQAGKAKGLDKPLPEVSTSQSTEEKNLEPVKASNKRDLDDDRGGRSPSTSTGNKEESSENQRGRSFTPIRNVISQNVEKKDVASEKAEDTTKENARKECREIVQDSTLPEVETKKTTESEKSGATGTPEKIANKKDSNRALKQQNHKKAVKGLTELNEERQLLVNTGVAVLVIVAVTAYVTHSFASAKYKN